MTVAPAGVENTGDIVSYSCVCHFSFFHPSRLTAFSCSSFHDSDISDNFPIRFVTLFLCSLSSCSLDHKSVCL